MENLKNKVISLLSIDNNVKNVAITFNLQNDNSEIEKVHLQGYIYADKPDKNRVNFKVVGHGGLNGTYYRIDIENILAIKELL